MTRIFGGEFVCVICVFVYHACIHGSSVEARPPRQSSFMARGLLCRNTWRLSDVKCLFASRIQISKLRFVAALGTLNFDLWPTIAGNTCIENSLRAKPSTSMPPQDDEDVPDVGPGAGRGDCESALLATEATINNSQSQQDAVLPEVGAVTSTEINAEEDDDTTFITAESQTHADDLATTCSGASPPSPGSNFRRGGVAEAEEVCEQNRHGMSAGGAGALTDADARSALLTFSGPDEKYPVEEALNVQVALAACAHDEHGNSNTCAVSDDSFTNAAAATAGARGDASTISSTRGDASTATIPTPLASASASGEVSSSLSGTTLTSTWTAGVLSSMGGDGNGNDSTREDAADFTNRTATAINQSIHDTPGAFYVTPSTARGTRTQVPMAKKMPPAQELLAAAAATATATTTAIMTCRQGRDKRPPVQILSLSRMRRLG